MWRYPPMSCDSTIERITDSDGQDWFVVTKKFTYGLPEEDTRDDSIHLDDSAIFLSTRGTSTLSLCCKYKTDFSAASDAIEIFYKNDVLGKLEQRSSWEGSFKVRFFDREFRKELVTDQRVLLGSKMRVQIDWSIHGNPIAEKLNWYVKNCFVKDIGEDRKETGKNVPIIKNQCYTQILSAKPISDSKVVTELFRFEYRSFSFHKHAKGRQMLACDVAFCLKDTECTEQTDIRNIECDEGSLPRLKSAGNKSSRKANSNKKPAKNNKKTAVEKGNRSVWSEKAGISQ